MGSANQQSSGIVTKNFHHPFEPYSVQQQFMQAVYDCIEDGSVGIFESPTGTGKSLSLICSSLTWLREQKRKEFDEAVASVQFDRDEPDWIIQSARDAKMREIRQMRADFEARLQAVRMQEQKVRDRHANGEPLSKKRKKVDNGMSEANVDDEAQFVLDDYESDDNASKKSSADSLYSAETLQLMERVGTLPVKHRKDESIETPEELKIFFCSRTHSQLSQFVGELQRVNLPPGLPPEVGKVKSVSPEQFEILKHLTLGSRKNLCINPKVSKLPSVTAVNERCIELQQSGSSSGQKCSFLPTKDTEDLVLDFRDHALAKLHDIEDLAAVGSKLNICPYYASRPAIRPAEIVTLPYPLLLQKAAREALGISVKNHVVIIDEAHNLMSAIEGIHSTQVSDLHLTRARESLMVYLQRFRNRLKGRNRIYVAQVVRVIDSLLACITALKTKATSGGTLAAHHMLTGKGVDQINLSKLVRYINDSKLARKVEGYVASTKRSDSSGSTTHGTTDVPNLMHVQNFFLTLMNPSEEGRFFWARDGDATILRYLLLDPSEHFREIVEDSRAVILAGGTMSPMEDYKVQLFPYVSAIKTLSCGHLIPPTNLLVRTIASDGNGSLEFTFKSRSDSSYSSRVGAVVLSLAHQVKGGMIVFFPSYGYLEQILGDWRKQEFMERLKSAKPVFFDSRLGSTEITFKEYSEAVGKNKCGAILLSVIGGKLSEGINFSDDLGRCVLLIGLPFPNLETPEWKARMTYIDEKAAARGGVKGAASRVLA